jgi:hypothetical protein
MIDSVSATPARRPTQPDTKKGLPNISVIVVGKQNHIRFYSTS